MNITKFIFFLVFLLKNIINQDSKYLVFNFSTNINLDEVTDDNYMMKKLDQKIYINLDIGQPPQTIPMTIKLWQYPTYILKKDAEGGENTQIKYDDKKSQDFKVESYLLQGLYKYDFTKGYFSKDSLNINPQLKDFYFFLATVNGVGSKNISGEIGLGKENSQTENTQGYPQRTRFIQQLLDNNLIEQKIFGFLYDTEYEGRIFFGDYLDNIIKKYKDQEMNEIPLETNVLSNDFRKWLLKFDFSCTSGNENTLIYSEGTFGFLMIEYGLIIGSTTFRDGFAKDYFNNKKCQNITVGASFHFTEYYCTDKSQFEDFPNISFSYSTFEGKYEFSFTKDELFVQRGNKYIFQIVFELFTTDGVDYWKIGQPFFRKYAIFLKEEEKSVKMAYCLNKFYKDEKEGLSTQTIVIIVLSVTLSLLIIAIVVYFKFFYKRVRKKRATELDEDYEYTAKQESKLYADDNDSNLI